MQTWHQNKSTIIIFLKIFSLKFCSCFKTNSCKKECLKTNQKALNGFQLFIASLTTATPLKYILCLNWGCMRRIRGSVDNQVVFSWVNIHRIENGRSMYTWTYTAGSIRDILTSWYLHCGVSQSISKSSRILSWKEF